MTSTIHTAVTTTTSARTQAARALAHRINLPFIADPQYAARHYPYILVMMPGYLGLQQTDQKRFAPFYIDFLARRICRRCKQASLRQELLARALGHHPREQPHIIDATAGLGRDSFILATLGFDITLLERSPIIHALLQDAMERARQIPTIAPAINKMHLIQADAITWLQSVVELPPAIIYLDPMFPQRQKSALAKKDMQLLQHLLNEDKDSSQLLATALACATRRVIIKRPRLAPLCMEKNPSFTLAGKSSRFDVYLR
jgi:16S rRNA (guanine1516-N2)-methyltransferase